VVHISSRRVSLPFLYRAPLEYGCIGKGRGVGQTRYPNVYTRTVNYPPFPPPPLFARALHAPQHPNSSVLREALSLAHRTVRPSTLRSYPPFRRVGRLCTTLGPLRLGTNLRPRVDLNLRLRLAPPMRVHRFGVEARPPSFWPCTLHPKEGGGGGGQIPLQNLGGAGAHGAPPY
jgi:hypothetical protein